MDLDKLEKLTELKERGALSEAEFEYEKQMLIYGNSKVPEPVNKSSNINTTPKISANQNKNMFNWYSDVVCKYIQFSGRASRSEYWYFVLVNTIISILLSISNATIESELTIHAIYSIFIFTPSLAVGFRRLHDVNKSGWWLTTPYIFIILILVTIGILSETIEAAGEETKMILGATIVSSIPIWFGYAVYVFYLLAKKGDEKKNDYGEPVI